MSQDTELEYDEALIRRLARLVVWTRCVLFWERLWPRLWHSLILWGLFSAAVLFDLFRFLPGLLHMVVLTVFALSAAVLLYLGLCGLRWPGRREALFRLERESGLNGYPLTALLDRPAADKLSPQAEQVWLVHQDRMIQAMKRVKRPWPRSELYKKDPYSLRAVLILLLVIGAIEARFDYLERLNHALIPRPAQALQTDWVMQLWVTPPAHTGQGNGYARIQADDTGAQEEPLSFIQHSKLLLRLEDYRANQPLSLFSGAFEQPFQDLGQGIYSLETTFDQGTSLTVKSAETVLFSRPVQLIADAPPEIELTGRTQVGERGHFRIGYKARDDFGLSELRLKIDKRESNPALDVVISKKRHGRLVEGVFSDNLASHPWAGEKVVMRPSVTDNFGQTAYGRAREVTLPQRRFNHPLALRLVAIRKNLYRETPEDRIYSRLELERILAEPTRFEGDLHVYLALRVAAQRLYHYVHNDQEINTVRDILWETAVHLDEGTAGTARNILEDMSRRMQDMLSDSSDRNAMENLFEQMRQSLDQYLQKMMQAGGQMQNLEEAVAETDAEFLGRDQLMEMLERARDLMRQGEMEAAKAMIEQFQSVLSRLAMQPQPDPEQAAAAKKIMDGLRKLEQDQQNLLDRTFKRTRTQEEPSLSSTQEAIREAEDQKGLSDRLQAELKHLQDMQIRASQDLKDALSNMQQAERSLQRGLDENAVQAQTRALEHLRRGLQEAAQSLARKMGMQPLPPNMPGRDPLGRGKSGPIQTPDGQALPTDRQMHRAREILQELYRRAGQKGRALQELEYIERLLDRF